MQPLAESELGSHAWHLRLDDGFANDASVFRFKARARAPEQTNGRFSSSRQMHEQGVTKLGVTKLGVT
eukprot:5608901-Pyramimonas_sp.AAC.1